MGVISPNNLGRANLRAMAHMDPGWLSGTLTDIEILESFNKMPFCSAEKEAECLIYTNTWPRFD